MSREGFPADAPGDVPEDGADGRPTDYAEVFFCDISVEICAICGKPSKEFSLPSLHEENTA